LAGLPIEDVMPSYEYKVVPAPVRGEKARGLKTAPKRCRPKSARG